MFSECLVSICMSRFTGLHHLAFPAFLYSVIIPKTSSFHYCFQTASLSALYWAPLPDRVSCISINLRRIKANQGNDTWHNSSLPRKHTWSSFSFRAWIGLIWEISARKSDQIACFFGARLFLSKYQNARIQWYMQYQGFSGYSFWKMFLTKNVRAGPGPGPMGPAHGPGPYWAWPRTIYGPGLYRYDFCDVNLC